MKRLILCSKASNSIPHLKEMIRKIAPQGKLVAITTAANTYAPDARPWFDEDIAAVKELGFNYTELDLQGATPDKIQSTLQDASVVFVSGGNTFFLLQQINQPGVRKLLLDYIDSGRLYIGSSAGASVVCPDIGYINGLDKNTTDLQDFSGLNAIPFWVMPHIDNPKYTTLMAEKLPKLKATGLNLVGLKDSQALYVEDRYMEICA
jgi:dipeptidase E